MISEHRFVLTNFTWLGPNGRLHTYEAGKHYLMRAAVAHAAAKRGLVAKGKPPRWASLSVLTPPEVLTETQVAEAEEELQALERYAVDAVAPVASE